MYNKDYEEYMRTVLGYNANQEIYNRYDSCNEDYNRFMPEIYNRLNPEVSRVCNMNTKPICEDTINEMIDSVIANTNLEEFMECTREEPKLRNGDVRNPNAREETRQRRPSRLLRDLIRILIITKLLERRPRPRPPFGGQNRMEDIQQMYNNTGNKYTIY